MNRIKLQLFLFLQNQWIKNHEDELDRLQKEVKIIEDIHLALPDGCWKRVQLEP